MTWLDLLGGAVTGPGAGPSAAVIVAHPDDETVGAGGHLSHLRHALFVYVTDGAPRDMRDAAAAGFATREEYAAARRRELETALALAGAGTGGIRYLRCADQEASLHLADLARGIAALIEERRPEVVLTHPYEGGHPDHDATAFAVHGACRLLEREGISPPDVVEMAFYHRESGEIVAHEFIPGSAGFQRTEGADTIFTLPFGRDGDHETPMVALTGEQQELKRRLIACYPSQWDTLRHFSVEVERFRLAPRYDFTLPPHEGLLLYECFPWGMTGERFRDLATGALGELNMAGTI